MIAKGNAKRKEGLIFERVQGYGNVYFGLLVFLFDGKLRRERDIEGQDAGAF